MRIAILGLGEAGSAYARHLAETENEVLAFDPTDVESPAKILRMKTLDETVNQAQLVLSLVGAAAAESAASEAIPRMGAGTLFADMNTMSPEAKMKLAQSARSHSVKFADVAIMAPVPRAGAATPLLVSGDGAEMFSSTFPKVGATIENVGTVPGTAAGLKLLRSVFMKGLAAVVIEALTAAESTGSGDWMLRQMGDELGENGPELVERLVSGTRQHAVRREHEMVDAADYLNVLDVPGWMTAASVQWLHHIAAESRPSGYVAMP